MFLHIVVYSYVNTPTGLCVGSSAKTTSLTASQNADDYFKEHPWVYVIDRCRLAISHSRNIDFSACLSLLPLLRKNFMIVMYVGAPAWFRPHNKLQSQSVDCYLVIADTKYRVMRKSSCMGAPTGNVVSNPSPLSDRQKPELSKASNCRHVECSFIIMCRENVRMGLLPLSSGHVSFPIVRWRNVILNEVQLNRREQYYSRKLINY
jgi:hypothetical protein